MQGTKAITTTGLSRQFGAVRAVWDLSIEVTAGTVFGFLGPNGSGKTTTIRLLLGIITPSAGGATVFGRDIAGDPDGIRALSGALLEHHGLYERLSAWDNLELAGRIWNFSRADRRARSRELLEEIGLYDRRNDLVKDWSRGMKQKLAVARALYHRPKLAFLDEPTAGLDPVAAAALVEDIRTLVSDEGLTVFLTTHNLAEAEKLCSEIAVIRNGRLLAAGTPAELRARTGGMRVEIVADGVTESMRAALGARPEVREISSRNGSTLLTIQSDARGAPIVRTLVEAGAAVEEVRKGSASLEEAFLALVEEDEEE